MYKAIINIEFNVHEILPTGCNPSSSYSGKALFLDNCDSIEEAIVLIKKKLSQANFVIIKEENKNGKYRNSATSNQN